MRGDAVTLGDLVDKITMLEVACRRLDVATEQLGDGLQQVRTLTDQRARPEPAAEAPPPARRSWRFWRQ